MTIKTIDEAESYIKLIDKDNQFKKDVKEIAKRNMGGEKSK